MSFAPLRQFLFQSPVNARRHALFFRHRRRIGHVAQAADKFQRQFFTTVVIVEMGIHIADAHFHADAHALAPFVWRIGEIFLFTLQQVQIHRDDNGPGHVGIIVFFDVAAIAHIGNEAQQAALADGVFSDDIVGPFVKDHFDILQIPVILDTHISKIHKITSFSAFLYYTYSTKNARLPSF